MTRLEQTSLSFFYFATSLAALTTAEAQVTYKVSPKSTLQISGTSTLSDWVVKSETLSGEMLYSGTTKTSIRQASVVLDVSTIKSEKGEAMDNKIYKALKSDEHPQISFVLSSPVATSLKDEKKLSVTGDVTLAGVKRPMTFDLVVSNADNAVHLKGSKSLKLSEFEIEPPTAMFGQIVIGDEIKIDLDLYLNK
jgi:polyisoprenoid-binding protein YceI